MKNLFLILLVPGFLFALGGDTLEYDQFVLELEDGDTLFTDLHYHPPFDSIQSIVNGRLGDENLAADANIDPAKLDSTKTMPMAVLRGDTVDYSLGIFDSVQITKAIISSIFCQKAYVDSIINGVYIDTINNDTIFSNAGEIINFTSQNLSTDTATSNVWNISSGVFDSVVINDTGSFTATLTGCTTSPTVTVFWQKTGNVITLKAGELGGTSNNSNTTITGLPAALQPSTLFEKPVTVVNNGTVEWGALSITNSGTITCYAEGGFWQNSGSKAIIAFSFSYLL